MKLRFITAGIATTIVNLVLNAAAYFLFLKGFFQSHPAVSEEFMRQLQRPPDQLIGWAMVATSVTMGFLITTIIKWSGASSFTTGLQKGCLVGFLFWGSVNFGLYASSNYFSEASVFADLVCSATAMTVSAAVAAWILGRGRGINERAQVS
jgi:hypothetical protein